LDSTTQEGDTFLSRKEIECHLGNSGGDVPQVHEGKLAEEKVHRGVELVIHTYEVDHC
jgi:hypothetical protein